MEYEIIMMARLGYGIRRLSDRHIVFYGDNRAQCLDWIAANT